ASRNRRRHASFWHVGSHPRPQPPWLRSTRNAASSVKERQRSGILGIAADHGSESGDPLISRLKLDRLGTVRFGVASVLCGRRVSRSSQERTGERIPNFPVLHFEGSANMPAPAILD